MFKKSLLIKTVLLLTVSLVAGGNAWSAGKEYVSSVERTHLLEVFSTQSCSSCPPAQEWVSRLYGHKQLYKKFIPIVYHVDYWDYLGWKDPYSSRAFSVRQRRYVSQWQARTAYTPMFVFNGRENRNRSVGQLTGPAQKVGVLKASCSKELVCSVVFRPLKKSQQKLVLHVAVIGQKIKTEVTAGENSGRTLKHDFLVLSKQAKKFPKKSKDAYATRIQVKKSATQKAPEVSLVLWLTTEKNQTPIQAVGGQIDLG